MQIIIVSSRLSKAVSLSVGFRQLAFGALAAFVLLLGLSGSLSYLTLRHATDLDIGFLKEIVADARESENKKTQELVRDNIMAIAGKVGQLQAQLLHLDTLGERLFSIAGIKREEVAGKREEVSIPAVVETRAAGGRGGPLIDATTFKMSAEDLGREVERLLRRAEFHSDYLSVVESSLIAARDTRSLLPTVLPVAANWSSSAYGWRADPITHERALHEGVDFAAPTGTPIVSAAAGIVIAAEQHADYGNMVEVDHGNGYTTRYAHASALHVQVGQLVKRGQRIAEVGNSGRSTGPHLHFEVRVNGESVNPARFLPHDRNQTIELSRR